MESDTFAAPSIGSINELKTFSKQKHWKNVSTKNEYDQNIFIIQNYKYFENTNKPSSVKKET